MAPDVRQWIAARRASDTFRSVFLIVLAILVANSAFIVLGYESNPIWWTTDISSRMCAWTCGLPTVDPNVGFITQPLGHLAAMDIVHGHVPWWNYFEGVGQPLAGEMQSAAFLPLVVLFFFPAGILLFHLSLQIIAGVSTYFLVRRLGIGPSIATVGAILFALNGTFSWIGNAAINPIAFMPMVVLGIEIVIDKTRASQRAGWTVMALGVAFSIYAGFPEMAYLDGLIAGGWALTRLFSLERAVRLTGLIRLAFGVIVGVALSAPVLVAFFDFVKDGDIGAHAAKGLSIATTPASSLPILVDPYLRGTLFGGPSSTPSNLLGYVTASVAVFALAGVLGSRLRALRLYLAGWVVAVLAGVTNFLEFRHVWELVPEMHAIAFARYVWPTVEFAAIILAVLGLSDIYEFAAKRTWAKWSVLVIAAVTLGGVFLISPLGGYVTGSIQGAVGILIILPFVALAVTGYALQFVPGRAFARIAAAVLVCESMAFFFAPTLRNPTSIKVATGSISYLQQNQGLNRFISLGVLNPNWGSEFSLNELNVIDLPLPTTFTNYIHANLAPTLKIPRAFVLHFDAATQEQVAARIANYEALGVEYLLTPRKPLDPSLSALGLTMVMKDARTTLYLLPHTTNFYSTALATCAITNATVDHLDINCPQATTLSRLELSMPGWKATVNGAATPITSSDALTQSIAMPAGTSSVAFSFLPPHEDLAALVGALAFLAMAFTWFPRRRRKSDAAPVDDASTPERADPRDDSSNDVETSEAPADVDAPSLHGVGEAEEEGL